MLQFAITALVALNEIATENMVWVPNPLHLVKHTFSLCKAIGFALGKLWRTMLLWTLQHGLGIEICKAIFPTFTKKLHPYKKWIVKKVCMHPIKRLCVGKINPPTHPKKSHSLNVLSFFEVSKTSKIYNVRAFFGTKKQHLNRVSHVWMFRTPFWCIWVAQNTILAHLPAAIVRQFHIFNDPQVQNTTLVYEKTLENHEESMRGP